MSTLQTTLDDRGEQYGDFREMAKVAQQLKKLLKMHQNDLTPIQVEAIDLICTKLARISCGNPNNKDSWTDIAGYAMLVVKDLGS